jgi:hypothetical protein
VEEESVCGVDSVKRDVPVTDWVNFGDRGSIPVGTGFILFVSCVQTGFGTHKASNRMGTRVISPLVNRPNLIIHLQLVI